MSDHTAVVVMQLSAGDAMLTHQLVTVLNDPEPTTPVEEDEFMECAFCRSKPGSPILCRACYHNRALISKLKKK